MLQPAELSVKVSVRKRRNLLITANSPWTTYLNESPSEKEGKSRRFGVSFVGEDASMKALPKRKGNWVLPGGGDSHVAASMKVPTKRKGN